MAKFTSEGIVGTIVGLIIVFLLLANLWSPFSDSLDNLSTATGGSGLGLAIKIVIPLLILGGVLVYYAKEFGFGGGKRR